MEWTNKSVEDRGGGIVVSMIAFYSYDSSSNLPDTFIFSVKCCLKRTKMSPGLANLKEKKNTAGYYPEPVIPSTADEGPSLYFILIVRASFPMTFGSAYLTT